MGSLEEGLTAPTTDEELLHQQALAVARQLVAVLKDIDHITTASNNLITKDELIAYVRAHPDLKRDVYYRAEHPLTSMVLWEYLADKQGLDYNTMQDAWDIACARAAELGLPKMEAITARDLQEYARQHQPEKASVERPLKATASR